MPCPYCGSYATVVCAPEGSEWYERCEACGNTFNDDYDREYDPCEVEGHEWREVNIDGELCDECVRCGAIDC